VMKQSSIILLLLLLGLIASQKVSRRLNVKVKAFSVLFLTSNFLKYCKIIKVELTTSGKTCANVTYDLKPVSRYKTLMSGRCDLKRTIRKLKVSWKLENFRIIDEFQVNITGWHKEKIEQNYRQLFNIENIDYCATMKTVDLMPWFKYFVEFAKEFLPGLVKDCPITGVSN
jgi:hypothetical protein